MLVDNLRHSMEQFILFQRCRETSSPDRRSVSSGRRFYNGDPVCNVDAPPLLVHAAVMRPAQRDEIVHGGFAAVAPVHQVVPVNPQCTGSRNTTGSRSRVPAARARRT
jgi:hypothetical protein